MAGFSSRSIDSIVGASGKLISWSDEEKTWIGQELTASNGIIGKGIQINPFRLDETISVFNLNVNNELKLSGSAEFINLIVDVDSNGLYNVDEAFHAIDTKIKTSSLNYARMRFAKSGSLDGSTVVINLTAEGADLRCFHISQIDYIVADVMIRTAFNQPWTNDLTSVQIFNSEGNIVANLDVPAAETGWEYRIIFVNENGSIYS